MFCLATERLTPGMTLARDIYSESGYLLLNADAVLDEQYIVRLASMGVESVFIKKPYGGEPETIIHERTQAEALRLTCQAFDHFCRAQNIQLAALRKIVERIVDEAIKSRDVLIQLSSLRLYDDYTFGHSINVCILSVLIGMKMRLSEKELIELAMGALLHDLGKLMIPPETLNKEAPLNSAEWQLVRQHGRWAFEVLRRQAELPLAAAQIAFQHHESFDGCGYPQNLVGEEIHLYARIVAVADVFDAVTANRPYRKAYLPHEAYEIIIGSRGTKFDPAVVDVFIANIALFPIGSTVVLDSGEVGVVVEVYPKLPTRPLVKVILDKDGSLWRGPERVVSMPTELTRFIIKVIGPDEAFSCCSGSTAG